MDEDRNSYHATNRSRRSRDTAHERGNRRRMQKTSKGAKERDTVSYRALRLETADLLNRAPHTLHRISLLGAVAGNPEVTESKIVPQGITRIETLQGLGNVESHLPPRTRTLGQADVL